MLAEMTRDRAKNLIVLEWDRWALTHVHADSAGSGSDGLMFFGYLQRERPHLLAFSSKGDPWQTVHGWLLQERRVKD